MLKNLSLSNLDFRKLKQRDITIIVLVLTLLLALLWYFYMFRPTQDRIAQLELDNQTLQADIDVGEAAKANLPLLREQLDQADADKRDFLATLPTQSQVSQLIEDMRTSASNSQVVLTGLSQGGAGDEAIQDIRSISFNLTTSGNFGNTMAFLDTLENLKRFTKVRQVGFSLEGEGVNDPNLNTTYDFNVYVYTGSETADPVIEDTVTRNTAGEASGSGADDTGETP
jgi:Tfp pilus assembly protein PilO